MKQKILIRLILVLCMGLLFFSPKSPFIGHVHADLFFIANKAVVVDSVTKTQIKDIFLGIQVKWPDNSQVKAVTMRNAPFHKEFAKSYTKKNPSQFKRYWKQMVFTGKGSFLKNVKSDDELIKYIGSTAGAIGYTSTKVELDDIKIITISN